MRIVRGTRGGSLYVAMIVKGARGGSLVLCSREGLLRVRLKSHITISCNWYEALWVEDKNKTMRTSGPKRTISYQCGER